MLFYTNETETLGYICEEQVPQEVKNNYTLVKRDEINVSHTPTIKEQIAQLKAELSAYDYIGVKIAMGVATVEEYADQIAYTQTLRNRINELGG